jgi:glycosyltransferase involved in cell wall biosynthesis
VPPFAAMGSLAEGYGRLAAPISSRDPQSAERPSKIRTRPRLLLVCSHVVQYASPIFRKMANDSRFEILVAYCSMQGAESGVDPGFGVDVSWDMPVLEGYPWVHVPNRAPRKGIDRFWGLLNPGLWKLIRDGRFDVVYVSGYFYASAWIAILAAKRFGVSVVFTTEAHSLQSLRTWIAKSAPWKLRLKKIFVRRILSLGNVLLAVSSGAAEQLRTLGFPPERIVLAPYAVDNDWWTQRAAEVDCDHVRSSWNIPVAAAVVLFCGKLQPWKAPQDVLEAFARADIPDSYLVYAGDGPLRGILEKRAQELGISERIRILGFVNQSQLPSAYRGADLLVLPSLYEGFGLVVNEAMLCGCPVAVSDRVGAKYDLVREGENGYIFPCGNVEALAAIYRDVFANAEKRTRMGQAARQRMETWSPREYVNAMSQAMDRAASFRSRKV